MLKYFNIFPSPILAKKNSYGDIMRPKKTSGVCTILFLATLLSIYHTILDEYNQMKYTSSLVTTSPMKHGDYIEAKFYCGASIFCKVYQEQECLPEQILDTGEIAVVKSTECTWTILGLTEYKDETLRGSTISLFIEKTNSTLLQHFPALENIKDGNGDVEHYAYLTKTIDESESSDVFGYSPQTWLIVTSFPDDGVDFNPCQPYRVGKQYENATCVAFKIIFNPSIYKTYYSSYSAILYSITLFISLGFGAYVLILALINCSEMNDRLFDYLDNGKDEEIEFIDN